MKAKTIILTVIATLFVVILLQNTEVVTFQFLFWQIAMSRIFILLLMLIIGFVLGYTTFQVRSYRKKKMAKQKDQL